MSERKTILFLDDETDILLLMKGLFEAEGFTVHTSETGEDALRILNEHRVDIILADLKLPVMDGFQFFNCVRKIPSYVSTPFLFVTAFNDKSAIDQANEIGASGYITKPFDIDELVQTIHTLLNH